MNDAYRIAELERKLNAMQQISRIVELNETTRMVRVEIGEGYQSAEIPWPADIGRNYKRWKPLRMGQVVVVTFLAGDTAQGVIVRELYKDTMQPPSSDANIDLIQFDDGSFVKHDAKTGDLTIHANGNLLINANGKVVLTGSTVELNP